MHCRFSVLTVNIETQPVSEETAPIAHNYDVAHYH